jgi:hypothetical protein
MSQGRRQVGCRNSTAGKEQDEQGRYGWYGRRKEGRGRGEKKDA